ncbi:MAG: spore germination protein, partial [Clostridia bacterium]|nr:spore germination protein [Clostridia bacterium]
KKAVCFEAKTNDRRHTSSPTIEKSVRGAKDAFIETMRANTSLVRRKIRNPKLMVQEMVIGRQTATNVSVVFIEGLTNPELVKELKKRLENMDTQGILGPAHLEEYICDNPYTPFPQVITTERADKFCMNLLDGRAGLFIDGLPFGYMVPGTFSQFLKVPEDHANHWTISSFMTYLRYFALMLALFLPAFYVAVSVYHQEMLPTKLMLSIIESKQNVPFSTVLEVFGILVAFELLQEAGLRLPTPVGETIGIIGALIVGQSAVEARVVSPIVIIVVATAGIAGYTIPSQELSYAVRLFRFLNLIIASFLGLFGLAVGVTLFVYMLCSLESFGVNYMTPFAGRYVDSARGIFRIPFFMDKFRDKALNPQNRRNQK